MEGQIEGLEIGGESVGLFNYVDAVNVGGAPGRNKFRYIDFLTANLVSRYLIQMRYRFK